MFVYQEFGAISLGFNMFMLVVVGVVVNGPYALITTAVSAELGTHSTLEGNSKALSTVTAIIDGTGSIGKAYRTHSNSACILINMFYRCSSWSASGRIHIVEQPVYHVDDFRRAGAGVAAPAGQKRGGSPHAYTKVV